MDYFSDTKTNRKALYPVLKAAHNKAIYKDKVSIHVDKLVLNGKTYTINDLNTFPVDLNPGHLGINDSGLIQFCGRASHFCNFHPSPFIIDGISYINNEQYYQSMKSEEFCDHANAAEIRSSSGPLKMFILCNKVKNFNENTWRQKCDDVMLKGLLAKFRSNLRLKQYVLDTGDAVIADCNGKDRYWGTRVYMSNTLSESVDNCPGKNKLGKLLMEARTILCQTS